jgi:formylmethanofuran dehydrogenase subunit E-like metal-binding protein
MAIKKKLVTPAINIHTSSMTLNQAIDIIERRLFKDKLWDREICDAWRTLKATTMSVDVQYMQLAIATLKDHLCRLSMSQDAIDDIVSIFIK